MRKNGSAGKQSRDREDRSESSFHPKEGYFHLPARRRPAHFTPLSPKSLLQRTLGPPEASGGIGTPLAPIRTETLHRTSGRRANTKSQHGVYETMSVKIFSTCPPSAGTDLKGYLGKVAEIARWSDHFGCEGILVYTDNSQVDPWLLAQVILQNTQSLAPLVAVQPVYMHPYWVAKIVTSIGNLYGRRLYLNMVAGGFKNDLIAMNDETPHDERYERLVEYTTIIQGLLKNDDPVTFHGRYHKVTQLKLVPSLLDQLFPGVFVSGSSDAGLAAAKALGATAVKYPKAPDQACPPQDPTIEHGIRTGIIARQSSQEAWKTAYRRFPPDRLGQLTHQLAMKVSDSVWHQELSELAEEQATEGDPYWLVPFQNYKTMCPYLVGSYEEVSKEIVRYIRLGYRTFILDIPPSEEDLGHTMVAFEHAQKQEAA